MPVYKATFTMTVMLEAPSRLAASSWLGEASLETIAYEIDQGSWIGTWKEESLVEVKDPTVKWELTQLGNDGSFFNTGEDK